MTQSLRAAVVGGWCLVATWCTPIQAQVAFTHMRGEGRDIRMTVIADGIYQFTTMRDSYVRMLNTVAIVNDHDVLIFDTGTRPSSARLILERIRQITNKPIRFLVNSHHHPDHWSGNAVYAGASPDVEIIATARGRQQMDSTAPVWAPRFAAELARMRAAFALEQTSGLVDGSPVTPEQRRQDSTDVVDYATFADESANDPRMLPNVTFTDTLTFFHGGREFRFMSMTGDAEGTTVLYLPREKVLMTGDVVSFPIPYVSQKPAAQAACLRLLAALHANTIIPGHGPAYHDNSFLELEVQLIESVVNGVAKARASGVTSLDELQRVVTASDVHDALVHGDPDLEQRFRVRVKALVEYVLMDSARRT
jgi:cyclase